MTSLDEENLLKDKKLPSAGGWDINISVKHRPERLSEHANERFV
ncbi:hypothetical protein AB1L07_13950 [Niallia alba]